MNLPDKRIGAQTVRLADPPSVLAEASGAGKKEGDGPLGRLFDTVYDDTSCGEKSWEKAESRMQRETLLKAAAKARRSLPEIELCYAGDLLNQCIGTSFAMRELGLPLYGLYGACSMMAEGLGLAAMAVDGGFAGVAAAVTSSHFCSAERQYRLPLEYGGQRLPTAQWTVTGAGAVILGRDGPPPYITHVTTGRIVDGGIRDAGDMGAAMVPAACDTLLAHLRDTGRGPDDYDLIVTGDLALYGMKLLRELMRREGVALGENYTDCGVLLYDLKRQDVHAGGSGCGCSAAALCARILPGLRGGEWNRVLFCGTGALLSPVSTAQGESIPSICHAVAISNGRD